MKLLHREQIMHWNVKGRYACNTALANKDKMTKNTGDVTCKRCSAMQDYD